MEWRVNSPFSVRPGKSHVERGKKIDGAVPLIGTFETTHDFATARMHVTGRPL